MNRPVMIMAGGTGGHIFPGLAVAAALQRRDVPVVWLGSKLGMEADIVPKYELTFEGISIRGLRGKGLLSWIKAPLLLARALLQAGMLMRRHQPRAVLSFGGFAAGPGGVMAWLSGKPLVVHEQNRIAGYTNRILARLASRVLTVFPDALPASTHVGNPVRQEICDLPLRTLRDAGQRPRLLVLGGSQGASALNATVPVAVARLALGGRPIVLHQCGRRDLETVANAYAGAGIQAEVVPFIDDMAAAYRDADLAVCRAGATTIAELSAAGLGAILVPYPHAVDDHQTANAAYLTEAGAAELMPESSLNPESLSARLQASLEPTRALAMALAARAKAMPDAAARVADITLQVSR